MRVNWDRADVEAYKRSIRDSLTGNQPDVSLEENSTALIAILRDSAEKITPPFKRKSSRPKLKVWNEEISGELQNLRATVRK